MYAAMENKTALIDRMLELGCDIHAKNKVSRKYRAKKEPTLILATIILMKICDCPRDLLFMTTMGLGRAKGGFIELLTQFPGNYVFSFTTRFQILPVHETK